MPNGKTMEIKISSLIRATALCTILWLGGQIILATGQTELSSLDSSARAKFASQKPSHSTLVRTAKLSNIEELTLQRDLQEITPGSQFTLSTSILPTREPKRMKWEWQVPRGITALTPTSGFVNVEREEVAISIRLSHTSSQNEKIKLNLYLVESAEQLIATGTYHSLDQDRLNAEKLALKERQEKYIEENPVPTRYESEPAHETK